MNEVNAALENPAVWNEPKRAQELGREKKTLETVVQTIDHLTSNLDDNTELYEMSKAEADIDGLVAIRDETNVLRAAVEELEFRRMFNNPADPGNCFIDIQAGAGGTEACDWAQMLLRQYLKYCERKGFKAEVLDLKPAGSLTKVISTVGDRVQGQAELFFAHLEPGEGVPKLFETDELLRWLDQMHIYEIGRDEAGNPLSRPDW